RSSLRSGASGRQRVRTCWALPSWFSFLRGFREGLRTLFAENVDERLAALDLDRVKRAAQRRDQLLALRHSLAVADRRFGVALERGNGCEVGRGGAAAGPPMALGEEAAGGVVDRSPAGVVEHHRQHGQLMPRRRMVAGGGVGEQVGPVADACHYGLLRSGLL